MTKNVECNLMAFSSWELNKIIEKYPIDVIDSPTNYSIMILELISTKTQNIHQYNFLYYLHKVDRSVGHRFIKKNTTL